MKSSHNQLPPAPQWFNQEDNTSILQRQQQLQLQHEQQLHEQQHQQQQQQLLLLNLENNPLTQQFFAGWAAHKALEFAQNLLLIGIGVAYKLLNTNTPETAFHKLKIMSRNVMSEYLQTPNTNVHSNQTRTGFSAATATTATTTGLASATATTTSTNNQHLERESVASIEQEIHQVKQRLSELTGRLAFHPQSNEPMNQTQQYQFAHPHHQHQQGVAELMRSQQEITQHQIPQGSTRAQDLAHKAEITPKITSSPPPSATASRQSQQQPHEFNRMNQQSELHSLRNKKKPKNQFQAQSLYHINHQLQPHLNDEAMKRCLSDIDEKDDMDDEIPQDAIGHRFTQQNSGLRRSAAATSPSSRNNRNYFSPRHQNNTETQLQSETATRLSSPSTIRQKQLQQQYMSLSQKRNNHKLGQSLNVMHQQQQQQVLTSSSNQQLKKSSAYRHVQSSIKEEVRAHRENRRELKQPSNEGETQKDEIEVHFSPSAQKRFYEKQTQYKLQLQQYQQSRQLFHTQQQMNLSSQVSQQQSQQLAQRQQYHHYQHNQIQQQQQQRSGILTTTSDFYQPKNSGIEIASHYLNSSGVRQFMGGSNSASENDQLIPFSHEQKKQQFNQNNSQQHNQNYHFYNNQLQKQQSIDSATIDVPDEAAMVRLSVGGPENSNLYSNYDLQSSHSLLPYSEVQQSQVYAQNNFYHPQTKSNNSNNIISSTKTTQEIFYSQNNNKQVPVVRNTNKQLPDQQLSLQLNPHYNHLDQIQQAQNQQLQQYYEPQYLQQKEEQVLLNSPLLNSDGQQSMQQSSPQEQQQNQFEQSNQRQ